MNTLQLRFAVSLLDPVAETRHEGLVFHRWLPDGERDALQLPVTNNAAEITVWVDRRGYTHGKRIIYAEDREEIDPDLMPMQTLLQAGMLHGMCRIHDVSGDDYSLVMSRFVSGATYEAGPHYEALGKRVYRVVYDAVNGFIKVVRFTYGHHWVRMLPTWDSRQEALGNYLRNHFQMQWSPDGGETWDWFLPSQGPVNLSAKFLIDPGLAFITQDAWWAIPRHIEAGYAPTVAAEVLSLAHALRDRGSLRHALIEGVTALELALDAYLDRQLKLTKKLETSSQALRDSGNRGPGVRQKFATAVINSGLEASKVDLVLDAIDTRNSIVHDSPGNLPKNADQLINALLRVTSHFLEGPRHRFPSATAQNMVFPTHVLDLAKADVEDEPSGELGDQESNLVTPVTKP